MLGDRGVVGVTGHRIDVSLGDRSYPIVVGRGVVDQLDDFVPDRARRAVVVTDPSIPFAVRTTLPSLVLHVGAGEDNKSLTTVERLCREFARFGLTRNDVVVAVGGGLVTDIAGFAAAVWHRGTAVIHVPTTLLGMVDAAIGGKTAVNIPEGKNLVGAFWQPQAVIADLDALDTLPERERRCGLGEIAKYHFIAGDDLLALPLDERVARCAEIKARIVEEDERESGRRALLNYGHTLAHALESAGNHDLAHGEAVAIGLLFAAELGRELGRIDRDRVEFHRRVVRSEYGLATPDQIASAALLGPRDLIDFMRRDKKATDGLTFVLDGRNGLEVVADIDPSTVESALRTFFDRPVG
ncbi:MAG: 3-dehydroquinate synthase [Acidimicrobiales bacterium mtb01]|nr:3-dehydroquinate synthase [Actinomycetota bacterium]TEX45233.1 MAG: 3-dehydroquinate synthase [Acidimicrobiales bacterium mtb01]